MRLHNRTASYLTITDKLTVYPHNSTELTDEMMKLQSVQYFINSGMAEVLKEGQAGTNEPTPKTIRKDSVSSGTFEDSGIKIEQRVVQPEDRYQHRIHYAQVLNWDNHCER